MSDMRLTDARLERDLRTIAPAGAPVGLQARIRAEVDMTEQDRGFKLLGSLPPAQRRLVLLAAAMLLVAGLAMTGVVGAILLDRQRGPLPEVTAPSQDAPAIAPPEDLAAFVATAYGDMDQLPPMTITAISDDGQGTVERLRILVDGSGAIRVETYPTPDATEPTEMQIYSGTSMGHLLPVDGEPSWYQQSGAISEDPRVFVYAAMSEGRFGSITEGGCEAAISPEEVYAESPGRRWQYVGLEVIAGRPAHHLECDGDLWIDVETRLTLKSRGLALDDEFQPVPGVYRTVEATEVVLGHPPAELFELRAPDGVPTIDDETYSCQSDPNCGVPPPTITTPPPAPGPQDGPRDIGTLVDRSLAATSDVRALAVTVERGSGPVPDSSLVALHDGDGDWRLEERFPLGIPDLWIHLVGPDHHYAREYTTDNVPYWVDRGPPADVPQGYPLVVSEACTTEATFLGVDLVHGRAADHISCGDEAFWIDRETALVVRVHTPDGAGGTFVNEVTDLAFGPQPPHQFVLPPGEVAQSPRP